jgi:hypothetical protein
MYADIVHRKDLRLPLSEGDDYHEKSFDALDGRAIRIARSLAVVPLRLACTNSINFSTSAQLVKTIGESFHNSC